MAAVDIKTVFEYAAAFLSLYFVVFLLVILIQNRDKLSRKATPLAKLPSLTIIIPAFNEEKTLAKTIGSALGAHYPQGKKQVIVVNDGSTDSTQEVAQSFKRKGVLVLRQKNAGKAAALNYALGHATGEFIATLDSDSYIDAGALVEMMGYFSDPEVGAVTSVMKAWRQETFWQRLQGVEYLVAVFTRRLQELLDAINVTPGPLSIFRAEVFAKIGGFDEKNLLEDQEMALRMQKHDYRIKCSTSAVVYTDVPRSFGELMAQRIRWYRGGMRNFISHYYLVSPRYGDFGLFVMPFAILSIFVLMAMLVFIIYSLVSGVTLNAVQAYLTYGLDAVAYGINPLQLIMVVLLAAIGLFSYAGLKYVQREYINVPMLFFYILFYSPIVLVFWAASFVQELRLAKLKW